MELSVGFHKLFSISLYWVFSKRKELVVLEQCTVFC